MLFEMAAGLTDMLGLDMSRAAMVGLRGSSFSGVEMGSSQPSRPSKEYG